MLPQQPQLARHEYWLLQHFKGWIVETEEDTVDPASATLMDFRVSQAHGSTFVYVLPFSERRALVEYTLFSKTLLPEKAYDAALKDYLQHHLHIKDYKVADREFGVIPMTNYAFPRRFGAVLHIGTAGGNTKASSGYTFRFIQKDAAGIVASLRQHGHPFGTAKDNLRFAFYDSVLLHILHHEQLEGAKIFAQLFQKNNAAAVLKFLDNETTLAEELRLISSLPIITFTKAAVAYLKARVLK
jgi:lycopene beta-cyclase